MNAVGLIEVIGYVAAIEACDACVKSASVNILSIDKVGAGIVTLTIVGDVGAVKSAIEAGEVAANKVGVLRATHVIPRIHKEVADNLLKKEERATQKYNKVSEIPIKENMKIEENKDTNTETLEKDVKIEENTNIETLREDIKVEENANTNIETLEEDIKVEENENGNIETLEEVKPVRDGVTNNRNLLNMNVKELKNLAREYNSSLTNKELNSLKKEDLVDLVDKLIREDK
ncbi:MULTISPECIES: BMC domain-containing protein [unclassified Clostridioides]|uniref:BMC domain-containing protein n=1 Tax=unclassified Clostridioides TaxID=2635829 RepID=UPI001D75F79B|nr:BMC domain-containing protein [Clostridioides sp. ZZV14-6153]MCC0719514.1 BMC domain-containing protein [Clostridioides sp. ZZV14-6105]MCC0723140.1 BMC domain-containing protein [Clostridioides sp. ZZV14-6104]MCC0727247.1 BMC domain-containing protein [Clostridioides sp. ZZV14-6045]MCC0730969.1 BMC domain-containing protein [Clostridioides sp. ZZV14-6048]MCC0735497.1 BMC domain-containing protein [Clostridioides sp. ZZV14-6009]WLD26933.1 BMC domain protein [Clostridioides difficile]